MKQNLAVLVKVLVWLGFFINSGIPSALWGSLGKKESATFMLHGVEIKRQQHSREEEGRFSIRMTLWEDKKEAEAQERIDRGGSYTSDSYFSDLREFVDSVQRFGQEPTGLLMTRLSVLDLRSRSQQETDVARDKYFPEMRAQRIEQQKHRVPFSETCFQAMRSISAWWLNWYLHSLWLALILFLVWKFEENEYTKIRFRSPVSFSIALVLYPIVIGYNIRKWWKNTRGEIEIRRSKDKIFSLLSNDEIALAKDFAKSELSLKQFKNNLRLKGYVPKYSVVAVLFAMVIMVFIPRSVLSQQIGSDQREAIYQVTNSYDYFHSTDNHVPGIEKIAPVAVMKFQDAFDFIPPVRIGTRMFWKFLVSVLCKGHNRDLEPIPLIVKSNSNKKTFN